MTDKTRSSITDLIPELGSEVVKLFKSESDLVRAEVNEKIERLETSVSSMAAGGICLLAALIVLLQAVVVALTNAGLGAGWASLIVGAATAVIGVILLGYGRSEARDLTPRRSAEEAQKTADMVKEKVR